MKYAGTNIISSFKIAPAGALDAIAFPSHKGSYVLVMRLIRMQPIRVGHLGTIPFPKGCYAYTGSACGPGGLAARLRHHLRRKTRCHWHIDYLSNYTTLSGVWLCDDGQNHEHLWADTLSRLYGASVPAQGFGSSDCHCRSHLLRFPRPPSRRSFMRLLGSAAIDDNSSA